MNQFVLQYIYIILYSPDNGIMEALCGSGMQFYLSLKDIVVVCTTAIILVVLFIFSFLCSDIILCSSLQIY